MVHTYIAWLDVYGKKHSFVSQKCLSSQVQKNPYNVYILNWVIVGK